MAKDKPHHIEPTVTFGRLVPLSPPVLGRDLIEFPKHASDQMKMRGISHEDVIKTIRSPTGKGLPTQPGRERYSRNKSRHETINVVFILEPDKILVVTAFSKIAKQQ